MTSEAASSSLACAVEDHLLATVGTAPQAASPTATGNSCAQPASANVGPAADKGSLSYVKSEPLTTKSAGNLYRVLVQAVGARNTASITETIVQF